MAPFGQVFGQLAKSGQAWAGSGPVLGIILADFCASQVPVGSVFRPHRQPRSPYLSLSLCFVGFDAPPISPNCGGPTASQPPKTDEIFFNGWRGAPWLGRGHDRGGVCACATARPTPSKHAQTRLMGREVARTPLGSGPPSSATTLWPPRRRRRWRCPARSSRIRRRGTPRATT